MNKVSMCWNTGNLGSKLLESGYKKMLQRQENMQAYMRCKLTTPDDIVLDTWFEMNASGRTCLIFPHDGQVSDVTWFRTECQSEQSLS